MNVSFNDICLLSAGIISVIIISANKSLPCDIFLKRTPRKLFTEAIFNFNTFDRN